jgi:pimeloyl-ACP methyl ester carboxylesterase
VDRVDILGFSFGATIAVMAGAENPARIGHIVAVGIDIDFPEAERYAHAFACDEAKRRGNRRAQRQLRAIGAPPHDTAKKFSTRAKWLTAFGGVRRDMGYLGLLWTTVRGLFGSPHYSIRQAVRALRAIERTQGLMLPHLRDFDLRKLVSRIEVPITFFQGRHDFATVPALVASYADTIVATRGKSLVWFDNSAHMPYFEEPVRFREALLDVLAY